MYRITQALAALREFKADMMICRGNPPHELEGLDHINRAINELKKADKCFAPSVDPTSESILKALNKMMKRERIE